DFYGGVNTTLGLPFVRTSPDHGTAFAIAGRGIARAESLIAALRLAGAVAARGAVAVCGGAGQSLLLRGGRSRAGAVARGNRALRDCRSQAARSKFPARSQLDGSDCAGGRSARPCDDCRDRLRSRRSDAGTA